MKRQDKTFAIILACSCILGSALGYRMKKMDAEAAEPVPVAAPAYFGPVADPVPPKDDPAYTHGMWEFYAKKDPITKELLKSNCLNSDEQTDDNLSAFRDGKVPVAASRFMCLRLKKLETGRQGGIAFFFPEDLDYNLYLGATTIDVRFELKDGRAIVKQYQVQASDRGFNVALVADPGMRGVDKEFMALLFSSKVMIVRGRSFGARDLIMTFEPTTGKYKDMRGN